MDKGEEVAKRRLRQRKARNLGGGDDIDNNSASTCQDEGLSVSLVSFEGYQVRKQSVPMLEAIFNKHGDIVNGSSLISRDRYLLEWVWRICTRLEALNFMELESMVSQIGDLDVEWLNKISEFKQRYAHGVSDIRTSSVRVVNEKQRAVKATSDEMKACIIAFSSKKRKTWLLLDRRDADYLITACNKSVAHGLF